MGVPYLIVVESGEYREYAAVIEPRRILVLDVQFQRDYKTCDDLGDSKGKGPGPARNFAWEHARDAGHAWHWVMDDNIDRFDRLNQNEKIRVLDGACFRVMEDFCDRYENVAMAGPAYEFMIRRKQKVPPFVLNTRIYSCNLIRTDLPFRWRGRYNEDTILSLDMLTAGWCTVQFNAFLQKKVATQVLKGGNTEVFYSKEGTLPKSQMQVKVYPQYSRLVWRFNRWHHHVDYRPFRVNKLIRKSGVTVPQGVNNYGMKLVKREPGNGRRRAKQ